MLIVSCSSWSTDGRVKVGANRLRSTVIITTVESVFGGVSPSAAWTLTFYAKKQNRLTICLFCCHCCCYSFCCHCCFYCFFCCCCCYCCCCCHWSPCTDLVDKDGIIADAAAQSQGPVHWIDHKVVRGQVVTDDWKSHLTEKLKEFCKHNKAITDYIAKFMDRYTPD